MKTETDETPKTKAKVKKANEGDKEHPTAEDVQDAGVGESDSSEGVTVPEEFQSQAHALVSGATKPHLSHLRDKINKREDEISAQEAEAKSKEKGGKGKMMFSSSDMPGPDNNY